jgi:hypothetical protein
MSDPRNVAHDKKVTQEKKHTASADEGQAGQPGKKTATATQRADPASASASRVDAPADDETSATPPPASSPAALEGSLVVLAQLKDLDFHSRAHLERLAALQMTIEDELKQTAMASPLAEVYAAQNAFQTNLTTLIDLYKAECDRLQSAA